MMGVAGEFTAKTRSEQKLEWLFQMSKHRKLTNDEWEDVRRCEFAIYQRARRQAIQNAEHEEAAA